MKKRISKKFCEGGRKLLLFRIVILNRIFLCFWITSAPFGLFSYWEDARSDMFTVFAFCMVFMQIWILLLHFWCCTWSADFLKVFFLVLLWCWTSCCVFCTLCVCVGGRRAVCLVKAGEKIDRIGHYIFFSMLWKLSSSELLFVPEA